MMANNNKKKKSKKKIIIWSIAGVIFFWLLSSMFCPKKSDLIVVQTDKVTRRSLTQKVTATGKINPINQVVITPEVTGEIVELPVKEGDAVKKGQLLIRIKPATYIAQNDRAKAFLESAQATLRVQEARLEYAKKEFERKKELFDKELVMKQEMDQVRSDLDSAKAQYESQKAQISQAQASLKETDESLSKTAIYAPMDGIVSQLNVELGERVLGSGFSQGTDIMTVADLSQIEATVEIDENDVVLVSVGDRTLIELDAFKNKKFIGVVTHIGNSARPQGVGTQEEVVNFEVKIKLQDWDERIRPGMTCNTDIETETKANVLTVPIQSVTARSPEEKDIELDEKYNNENFGRKKSKDKLKVQELVFVIEKNLAVSKPVKIGISDDYYIEIIDGLKEGEAAVSGPYKAISRELKDKSKVKVEDAAKKKNDGKK